MSWYLSRRPLVEAHPAVGQFSVNDDVDPLCFILEDLDVAERLHRDLEARRFGDEPLAGGARKGEGRTPAGIGDRGEHARFGRVLHTLSLLSASRRRGGGRATRTPPRIGTAGR